MRSSRITKPDVTSGKTSNGMASVGCVLSQFMIGKGIFLYIYMLESLIMIFFLTYKYTKVELNMHHVDQSFSLG